MTTSATDTSESSVTRATASAHAIQDRIAGFADQASDRSEFLKLLAAELAESFSVELVAVTAPQWSTPMMLVSDPAVAQRIDVNAIGGLLKTSTQMPIACDVPLRSGSDSSRALRVEITGTPEQAALLLMYEAAGKPTAIEQVQDLKRLNEYAHCTRGVIAGLPPGEIESHQRTKPNADAGGSVSLGQRQSLQWFHRDLDVDATAYRVANETRRLIGCDRVSVLLPKGQRFRVHAVSGVSVVDRRSNSVKSLQRLAQRSAVMERAMIMPSEEPLPPQIQEPLDEYLDESGVLSTVMLPLHEPSVADEPAGVDGMETGHGGSSNGPIIALVFLEYFTGTVPRTITPAMKTVASEATFAVRNAVEHNKVFGLRFWKLLGGLLAGKRWALALLLLATLGAALVASLVIQIDHEVIASGTLVPAAQRQVFAKVDGIVKEIFVADGDLVAAGDQLFRLENADLESRAENLTGEIQTTSRRLASVESLRLSVTTDPNQTNRLAIEERQLRSEVANFNAELDLIRQQQDQLVVRSPIAGTISGWQLERQLADRPVSRGNLLVSVVDHDGPWSLRLQVPDEDAGPVLESFEDQGSLAVRFAVATQPESTYAARLETISTAARLASAGGNVVDATADIVVPESEGIESFEPSDARVGADVTAKIVCGKRSVMRSWFGDVFDFMNRNVLFYFR